MLHEDIKVKPFPAIHPDDTTAFRLESGGKSVVYLLDYETGETVSESDDLVRYCNLADVIIFDATFLPEDYERKKGWGHSTYESGIQLAKLSGCKHMIFAHFDQHYSDQMLDSLVHNIEGCRFSLAYDGLEMTL